MDTKQLAKIETVASEISAATREWMDQFADDELMSLAVRWMAEPYPLLIHTAVRSPEGIGTLVACQFMNELLRRSEVLAMLSNGGTISGNK